MTQKPDYARMRAVINKDAYVTGLFRQADAALAAEVGCEVGDPVGCAVFALAVDAGVDPGFIANGNSNAAYAAVDSLYGAEVCNLIWHTNDAFDDRPTRLRALNLLIDRFEKGVFEAVWPSDPDLWG